MCILCHSDPQARNKEIFVQAKLHNLVGGSYKSIKSETSLMVVFNGIQWLVVFKLNGSIINTGKKIEFFNDSIPESGTKTSCEGMMSHSYDQFRRLEPTKQSLSGRSVKISEENKNCGYLLHLVVWREVSKYKINIFCHLRAPLKQFKYHDTFQLVSADLLINATHIFIKTS